MVVGPKPHDGDNDSPSELHHRVCRHVLVDGVDLQSASVLYIVFACADSKHHQFGIYASYYYHLAAALRVVYRTTLLPPGHNGT